MKYSIDGHQKLTSEGKLGVALVFIAPIVLGLAWAAALSVRDILWPAIFMFCAGLSFLAGIVLLVIGRTFHFTAQEIVPSTETKGLWSK